MGGPHHARPVAAAGRETHGLAQQHAGLPGALVDPDAAPLVLYSPGVSGIRFWWGPLEEGASTVGEVLDR